MKTEKSVDPLNGYLAVAVIIVLAVIIFALFQEGDQVLPGLLLIPLAFTAGGLVTISPNNAKVLLLFGAYQGSVKQNGLFWVIPFYKKLSISLRARNFESDNIKVNDKLGNPIMISVYAK